MDEPRTLIAEVIAARQTAADIAATLKASREAWEAANAELIQSHDAAKVALDGAEAELRAWGRAAFRETGNKKPAPGVGVRVSKKLIYPERRALDWALQHAPVLVMRSLDKKAFEALMKTQPQDFVTEEETVTITLATDLEAGSQ